MADDNRHLTETIVEVDWVDSAGLHGWHEELQPGVAAIKSVGYLVEETAAYVTLTEAVAIPKTQAAYGCQTSIPKVAITRTKYLRRSKKK